MALVGNRILQTANSPGTGTFNLIAPPAAFVSFVVGCGVGQAYYYAFDASSFEYGIGTVASGTPDTLSRDTVLGNSLGTTARINFTGALTIYTDTPAERDVWASADNSAVLVGNRKVSGVAAATAVSDAPRFDQVADKYIGTYTAASGIILIPFPNATDRFEIELRYLNYPSTTQIFGRISVDGGATYLSGASEYGYQVLSASSFVASNPGATSFMPFTGTGMTPYTFSGNIELDLLARSYSGRINAYRETDLFSGYWSTAGTPTHIIIGGTVVGLTSGTARLIRKVF